MSEENFEQICPYALRCSNYDPWSQKCNIKDVERIGCYFFGIFSVERPKQLPQNDLNIRSGSELSNLVVS
jgi:hypothetical protein